MRCAVIGAGAWGTALADLLASNGHETVIWAFEHGRRAGDQGMPREPSLPHRPVALRHRFARRNDQADEALDGAELVVYATPSQHMRQIARAGARCQFAPTRSLAVASKGIERGTLR